MNKEIINLRHDLHKHPEVSNNEYETSKRISEFFKNLKPDKELSLGNTSKLFIFDSKTEGNITIFRSELDALPISENTYLDYSSIHKNVAHSCGHDGHMAIISALAQKIAEDRPKKGKVALLFQAAEEVEQGARDIVNNPDFKTLKPDYIFGLHNVPGKELHKIIIKENSFSAASKGMTIHLEGETSHAAEPEKGVNPALAVSKIIKKLNQLISKKELFTDLTLLTFIYIRLGEISFGTSAGKAEMGITLRSFENSDIELLTEKVEEIITNVCKEENLKLKMEYDEVFPATVNNKHCNSLILNAANQNEFNVEHIEEPFRWSEDFGYYSQKYNCGFFGLGSGLKQPALHNSDYNFPDEIIETGANMFFKIYKQLNF
ncbi:MAG: amidohydrolase [Marinilabiliales bacterium]|nr:MAG: amidohydrolase [Marinilabiliales bacterium]